MKPLVAIYTCDKTDIKTIELAQDVLTEFHIPYETFVVTETPSSIEKLYFQTSTIHQKGIEVIILCGSRALAHFPRLDSLKTLPIIFVPLASDLKQTNLEKKYNHLLETELDDAHVAGLWAVEILATKHWSIYNRLKYKQQVS